MAEQTKNKGQTSQEPKEKVIGTVRGRDGKPFNITVEGFMKFCNNYIPITESLEKKGE
jgi:hypothetical protein